MTGTDDAPDSPFRDVADVVDRLAADGDLTFDRPRPETTAGGKKKQSQATMIVELCADLDLFHAGDEPYAAIEIGGHREIHPLRSRAMRSLLARRYYVSTGGAAGNQAIEDGMRVLMGRAIYDGDERAVHTRIAARDSDIYIDLCDRAWQAIEIMADGWRIVDRSPVHFVRRRGMRPLPLPRRGGTIDDLRGLLNLAEASDYRRIVAWLVQALRPTGPYPVLVLGGEQGSAKSTTARILRALIDPNTAPIRTAPRNEHDLVIAASNGWVIALDNLSGLPPWLSDGLCRLSTGGGFSARELYSDADEILIDAQRPVVVNGIDAIATRPDLADRSIVVTLEPIPDDHRRPETELWRAFDQAAPSILCGLLDAVSGALAQVDTVDLPRLPRMADHATWIEAASDALGWPAGQYVAEHTAARDEIVGGAADSPVGAAVMTLIDRVESWTGTASDLLAEITATVETPVTRAKTWPTSARAMANQITRLAPALRGRGYSVERPRRQSRARIIELGQVRILASSSSLSSQAPENKGSGMTIGDDSDDPGDGSDSSIVTAKPSNDAGYDDSDDSDDVLQPCPNSSRSTTQEVEV